MLQISREFLTKTSHIKNFHVLIRVLMWYGFQYDFCLLRYTSPISKRQKSYSMLRNIRALMSMLNFQIREVSVFNKKLKKVFKNAKKYFVMPYR